MIKKILLITAFVSVLGFSLPALANGCCQNPAVQTQDATNINYTTAVLNGNLTATGGCPPVDVWFQYGKTVSYGLTSSHQNLSGAGVFSANISGLDACTTYNFRAVAKNTEKTAYGSNKTFTTPCYPLPVVDIKANGSDGPITINYNASATLSWTSSNASSCSASGDWSGSKSIAGSQSTGNLTSSKTYTITCTGLGGSVSDMVIVNVGNPVISVALEAIPSSGCAPLNNVDLKATVSGNYSGYITYFFDCTNDGSWDKIDSKTSNTYTADVCSYNSSGSYTAKVRIENQGLFAETTTQITVYNCDAYPVVDIKANGSDGPITINYNNSANLTWTSSNANSCTASGDWSGTKPTSGYQSTGNLNSSKVYTITCTGSGGTVSDSVWVNVQGSSLDVALEAIPSSGCAPLNNVDLKAQVSGNYSGYITYFFDCTNDGSWDKIDSKTSNTYTASDICDYDSSGTYNARVRVENQGFSDETTVQINAYNCGSSPSVDIKANGSNGPIYISYNTSANLTWTSNNVSSCSASGDWSGSKSIAGSQSTENLTSSKYYTITCTGSGGTVSDSVQVNVSSSHASGIIFVEKFARNLSDGGNWATLIYAKPGDGVSFFIKVKAENSSLSNVIVTDTLPDRFIYQSDSLKIDGASASGNVFSGLSLGNLSAGQEKTITFSALVAGADKFNFGQNQLINVVLVSGSGTSNSKSATVVVSKTAVAGAATGVSTGITNNLFLDSFFLPLSIALGIAWFFKSYIVRTQDWFSLKKKKYQEYSSQKMLQLKIAQIKAKEFLLKK